MEVDIAFDFLLVAESLFAKRLAANQMIHFLLEEPALSTSVQHVRACLDASHVQDRQTRVA